jgi:flagellum-specific peptidoglycan hydrolase FlgJ
MKKVFWFCFFLMSLASCLPKQQLPKKTHPRVSSPNEPIASTSRPATPTPPITTSPVLPPNASAEAYIAKFKDIAIQEMNQYGIPASIKLAQALLESGNGNSKLARQANNHFGIKCASGWTGKRILKDDDEVDDCFRVYQHPEESYRDHSEFLLRKRYAALFELDKNDYVSWAKGLKSAGYATNPKYADLLVSLIERYRLFQYDSSESRVEKIQREERVFTEIVENIPNEAKDAAAKPPVAMQIHEVKPGETLFAIAKRYDLSIESLKQLNNIKGDGVMAGQLLLVSN